MIGLMTARTFLSLVLLFLVAGSATAKRQDHVLYRKDGEKTQKLFYQEIVRTDRVNLRAENYFKGRSKGSETIKLTEKQVMQLRKAVQDALPIPQGEPDKIIADIQWLSVRLTVRRYGDHRRRAFLLKIDKDSKYAGRDTAYYTVSKRDDDIKQFLIFLKNMEAAAKRR